MQLVAAQFVGGTGGSSGLLSLFGGESQTGLGLLPAKQQFNSFRLDSDMNIKVEWVQTSSDVIAGIFNDLLTNVIRGWDIKLKY